MTRFYTTEDGEIIIPRGTVHAVFVEAGEEVIVEEKTTPMDEGKEVFFRNFFAASGGSANPFAVMQVFYHGDGYPVLLPGIRFLEKGLMTILGNYRAPLLGYKLKYYAKKLKKHQYIHDVERG